MPEPKGIRPQMGAAFDLWAPEGGKGSVLEWSWVQDKMYSARSYWVVTSPKSGPPHPMPVWGVLHRRCLLLRHAELIAESKDTSIAPGRPRSISKVRTWS